MGFHSSRSRRRWLTALAGAWLVLLAGGGALGWYWTSVRPVTECDRAASELRFEDAVDPCTSAFERTGEGRYAATVALAHVSLYQDDEAWRWANEPAAKELPRARRVRAILHLDRRENAKAESELQAAIASALAGKDAAEAALAAHSLAGERWRDGRFTEAYELIELSAEQAKAAGHEQALALAELARGDLYRYLGDAQRAELHYRSAMESSLKWPREQAVAAFKTGLLFAERGDLALARAELERALALSTESGHKTFIVASRLQLAKALVAKGEPDAAEWHLDALEKQDSADVRLGRARVALARGQSKSALELLHSIDASQVSSESALDIAVLRGRASLLSGDADAAALAWTEAISRVEELGTREPEHQSWATARRRQAFDALFALHASRGEHEQAWSVLRRYVRAEALSLGGVSDGDTRELVVAAEALKREWETHAGSLKEAEAEGVADPRDVLAVHEAEGQLWVGTHIGGVARFVSAGELSELGPLLHRLLGDASDVAAASELGESLWAAARLSPSRAPLYIAATGRLRRLPFAALMHAGRYWMEHRPPARLLSLDAPRGDAAPFSDAVVVMGDPSGSLPQAREEARWVARHLKAFPLIGPAATRAAILEADRPSLLHLATHATVGLHGTALLLADGDLSAREVRTERPRARVVVLASCASALGRESSGADSLSNAFLSVGSSAVVATLQRIPDDVTRRMIEAFYRNGGAADPIGALSRAQVELHRELPVALWSSFVVSVGPKLLNEKSEGQFAGR